MRSTQALYDLWVSHIPQNAKESLTLTPGHSSRSSIPAFLCTLTLQANEIISNIFIAQILWKCLPAKCLQVRDGIFPFAWSGKVVTICKAYLQNIIKTLRLIEISWINDAKKIWMQELKNNLNICALFLAYGMSSGAKFLKWPADEKSSWIRTIL